jgi:hypothetical protein
MPLRSAFAHDYPTELNRTQTTNEAIPLDVAIWDDATIEGQGQGLTIRNAMQHIVPRFYCTCPAFTANLNQERAQLWYKE